jgi:MoxR-like ATPase
LIVDLINSWLFQQIKFADGGAFRTNSPESLARKEAMSQLVEEFEELIEERNLKSNGENLRVSASRGIGVDTSIPWIRFFDSRTPRPTKGWSLVLFAHEKADAISLVVGLGVYRGAKKAETIKFTDSVVRDSSIPAEIRQRPKLGQSSLATRYEVSSPISKTWTKSSLSELSDQDFVDELIAMVKVFDYVVSNYEPPQSLDLDNKVTGKWLVQYNPGIWDFDSSVQEGNREITFRVGNYKDQIQEGDPVVLWRSGSRAGVVGLGRVKVGPEDRAIDDVTASYFKIDVDRSDIDTRIVIQIDQVLESFLPKTRLSGVLANNNIFRAPQSTSPFIVTDREYEDILNLTGLQAEAKSSQPIDVIAGRLLVSEVWLQQVVHQLETKKQIIFQGPPGTGKTFIARALAEYFADGVNVVQFHPSYAYEDFVEGFRPFKAADSFGFELKPGPLVAIANEARSQPEKKYVLIIDEINRGHLAKVFGELYFLLEYRDQEVTMQYRSYGETFSLPENLYIIGTMNTADRSVTSLDMAIRRRFSFVDLSPVTEPVAGLLGRWLERENINPQIENLWEHVNTFIADEKMKLGPSYFMKNSITEEIEIIWNFQIYPQLREIFFDNEAILGSLTFAAVSQAVGYKSN